jgi:hypothetical protein
MGAIHQNATLRTVPQPLAGLLGVVALAIATRLLLAPGFYGSDDLIYSIRGAEIANGIWRPSQNVGELRYGISLPIAFFLTFLAPTQAAYSAWSFVCSVAEVALVFAIAYEVWNVRVAVLAATLLALAPLHSVYGSIPLADAPLAFLFSLALVSLYFAERRQDKRWYVLAGLAAGFSWWVKPHAAVPFATVFVLDALLWRTWKREWLLLVGAGVMVVLLELAMFALKFGDPLFAIKAILTGINRNYIASDPMWGSDSPAFYFRQMFIDGRDMWLLPFFALAGLVLVTRKRSSDGKAFGARFMAFWAVALVSIFSFFVLSVHPMKWIPKQENYALMFLAPLAVLGGYALAQLRTLPLALALTVFAVGAWSLAALESYRVELHYSGLHKSTAFARSHPDASVYLSRQAMNEAYLANLSAGVTARLRNALPISTLVSEPIMNASAHDVRFALIDRDTPEFASTQQARTLQETMGRCWQRVATLEREAHGPGAHVLRVLSALRPRLPPVINRHLGFTDKLTAPPEIGVYEFLRDGACTT